jgi:hypothetical protein
MGGFWYEVRIAPEGIPRNFSVLFVAISQTHEVFGARLQFTNLA